MVRDIQPVLADWEYPGPEDLAVREIRGTDGQRKLQIRLELGILQMEFEGRPDGTTPYGHSSLLEYYRELLAYHQRKQGSDTGFSLTPPDCAELRRESLQYYHRRICFLKLQYFGRAARDAEHNLGVLDLLRDYAADREDWLMVEQYRPFIMSHQIRALAFGRLMRNDFGGALDIVEKGIADIRNVYEGYGILDQADQSEEIAFLTNLAKEINNRRPLTTEDWLRQQLQEAISREEYEKAAELRDQLRQLRASQ